MAAYAGVMATFTGGSGNDVANATTGTLTGFSGGTVAQLQDSSGDTFNGGNGADTIVAGSGDDTINIANGQFVAGESIKGGGNTASGTRDQIVLTNGHHDRLLELARFPASKRSQETRAATP